MLHVSGKGKTKLIAARGRQGKNKSVAARGRLGKTKLVVARARQVFQISGNKTTFFDYANMKKKGKRV